MSIANKSEFKGSYISYFSNLVKAHGGINLAQGIPGFQPPAVLLDILAGIRNGRAHQYAPGTGNLALLDQLRLKYRGAYQPDQADFFVVNGATEAISLIYTHLFRKHRDALNVLAFSPAYESYIHLPRLFGNKVSFQPLTIHGSIDLNAFEKRLKSEKIKLVFLCSPGNPWGVISDQKTVSSMCDICEQNDCSMVIDAVYSALCYSTTPPWYPTSRISKHIYYVNSFSKRFSITGWRIGYLLAHRDNLSSLEDIHDYIGLSSPAPMQAALEVFLQDKTSQNQYVEALRNTIASNFESQNVRLTEVGFRIPRHDGGYFIWAQCPDHIGSGVDFAFDLYNLKHTAVIPGAHFGREWESYIRINIALPPETLRSGIDNICEFVNDSRKSSLPLPQ